MSSGTRSTGTSGAGQGNESDDGAEGEPLWIDHYIDSLLQARAERSQLPGSAADRRGSLEETARRLRADLVRVHPSFRFAERLARRLEEEAQRLSPSREPTGRRSTLYQPRPDPPAGRAGEQMAGHTKQIAGDRVAPGALLPRVADERGSPRNVPRPILIGGALTSAALSLAGAAYVAWRRARTPGNLMVRAARAARAARLPRAGGLTRAARLAGAGRLSRAARRSGLARSGRKAV